nr:DoxX family protein [Bacteroidota bacterium]
MKKLTGWAIILITIFSAYLIIYFKNFNVYFSVLLIFEIVLAIRYRKIFTPAMIRIGQVLMGLLFIFSGFVKGVDPLGTAYRVEDYFIAYGTEWMMPAAVVLSFILNAAEFVLGGLLLFNLKPKLTSWLVLIMMIFFTITTWNDALNNPVPDCGCFGDALIMTNWQTLYKNLVINVFVLIIFLARNRIEKIFGAPTEWSLGVAIIVIFIGFQYYNFTNLPLMDFRPWKVGNKMIPENPLPIKYYLTYKNKTTGEEKEYLSPDYPYNNPEWMANWEFAGQRVEDPNQVPGMDLAIISFDGEDVTSGYLNDPGYHFIVVAWDLDFTDKDAFQKINGLFKEAFENELSFIVLTSSLSDKIEKFVEMNDLSEDMAFYNADDIVLKTMIRSNPGLILMKGGEVINKWHFNNFPDWDELQEGYLQISEMGE